MPVIDPVSSDSDFPKKTTVAVIGGGVIGVATALELSERGVPVVLLEKGIIAGEQSSRNWGWCRQMGRDPREIPLVRVALDAWDGMNARIGGETGVTVIAVACDITTPAGQAEALAATPQVDILINNAGGPPPGDFRSFTREQWLSALNANMLTPIDLIKATLDGMIERRFGRVVNITSSSVKAPIDILGLSNGARSGLTGFVAGVGPPADPGLDLRPADALLDAAPLLHGAGLPDREAEHPSHRVERGRIEVLGADSQQRLLLGQLDHRVVGHRHRQLQCSGTGPFADPRLEHPQLAALDSELDVLSLAVVVFEDVRYFHQPVPRRGNLVSQARHLGGRARAGDDIFTLRVEQVLTVEFLLTGGRVAREGHARAADAVGDVAVDHHLHVGSGAPRVRVAVVIAVVHRTLAIPALEDGFDAQLKLLVGVVREGLAGELLAQHGILRGHAHRTGVQVAFSHHDTPENDQST